MEVIEDHHRAMLCPSNGVKLVMVPHTEVEEGLPRLKELALHRLVVVHECLALVDEDRNQLFRAEGGWEAPQA